MRVDKTKDFFWEKFRPFKYKQVILSERLKSIFDPIFESKELKNHYIFHGPPATGKTTMARVILDELYNGKNQSLRLGSSQRSGVDVLRTTINDFIRARGGGVFGTKSDTRIVFIDEVDEMSTTFHRALRETIEKYQGHIRFLFTCNYINNLEPAILSRMRVVDFSPQSKSERLELLDKYEKRILSIVRHIKKEEDIEIPEEFATQALHLKFPDIRAVYNELQSRYENENYTYDGIPKTPREDFIHFVLDAKKTDSEIFSYVEDSISPERLIMDLSEVLNFIHKEKPELFNKIGDLAIIIAEYQYRSNFSLNEKVNVIACLASIRDALNE